MPGGSSPKLLDENGSKAATRASELHVSTTSAYVKSAVFGALDATVTIFAFIASWCVSAAIDGRDVHSCVA